MVLSLMAACHKCMCMDTEIVFGSLVLGLLHQYCLVVLLLGLLHQYCLVVLLLGLLHQYCITSSIEAVRTWSSDGMGMGLECLALWPGASVYYLQKLPGPHSPNLIISSLCQRTIWFLLWKASKKVKQVTAPFILTTAHLSWRWSLCAAVSSVGTLWTRGHFSLIITSGLLIQLTTQTATKKNCLIDH